MTKSDFIGVLIVERFDVLVVGQALNEVFGVGATESTALRRVINMFDENDDWESVYKKCVELSK